MLTVQQTRKLAKNTTGPKLIIDTEKKHKFYNITKAKHALWLVNSSSTIYPWVYAADMCANVM